MTTPQLDRLTVHLKAAKSTVSAIRGRAEYRSGIKTLTTDCKTDTTRPACSVPAYGAFLCAVEGPGKAMPLDQEEVAGVGLRPLSETALPLVLGSTSSYTAPVTDL